MADTEHIRGTAAAYDRAFAGPRPADEQDVAGLEAGLDALDSGQHVRAPLRRRLLRRALPPVLAAGLVLLAWQSLVWVHGSGDYRLPPPAAVWDSVSELWHRGTLFGIVWTSVWRGLSGFLLAIAVGTPLGLLVARSGAVRTVAGPLLSGLQLLPSVAWVPPAVIWLGLNGSMMYAVILLGAAPSIANGLVAGIDRVPPIYLRAGRTMGATGLSGVRHVVLPAALPGYVSGLKQGWAFAWRSLMAAEIIASSPDLGVGLGQLLELGRESSDMARVALSVLLILAVGILVDLAVFCPVERWLLVSRGLAAPDGRGGAALTRRRGPWRG